jgi:predicted small lipoprotein YifL
LYLPEAKRNTCESPKSEKTNKAKEFTGKEGCGKKGAD